MATVYSVLATAFELTPSLGGPAEWQLPGVINSPVRCMIDSYSPLGTETAGTVIRFFTDGVNQTLSKIIQGANILWFDIVMASATSNLTLSVGDLNSATRYVSASTGPASAGITRISGCVSTSTVPYTPYIIGTNPSTAAAGAVTNGDDQIIVTTGGATLSATPSIMTLMMFYTWP